MEDNLQSQSDKNIPTDSQQAPSQSYPEVPEHHKHAKIILIFSFFVLLIVIAAGSYYLIQQNDSITDNVEQQAVLEEQQPVESNDDANVINIDIPSGYIEYKNDYFSLYYPETWGRVTVDSKADATIYTASFSNNDKAKIYMNSGSQDLTGTARGGAFWDCVGFTDIGSKDYACMTVYIENGEKKVSGSSLADVDTINNLTTNELTIINKYEYFEQPTIELLFNPNSYYYGGTLVITEVNEGDLETLREIANYFSTVNVDGL